MIDISTFSFSVEDSNAVNRGSTQSGSTRHIEMTPMNTIDTGTTTTATGGGGGGGMPTAGDNSWVGGGDHMTSLSPGLSTTYYYHHLFFCLFLGRHAYSVAGG